MAQRDRNWVKSRKLLREVPDGTRTAVSKLIVGGIEEPNESVITGTQWIKTGVVGSPFRKNATPERSTAWGGHNLQVMAQMAGKETRLYLSTDFRINGGVEKENGPRNDALNHLLNSNEDSTSQNHGKPNCFSCRTRAMESGTKKKGGSGRRRSPRGQRAQLLVACGVSKDSENPQRPRILPLPLSDGGGGKKTWEGSLGKKGNRFGKEAFHVKMSSSETYGRGVPGGESEQMHQRFLGLSSTLKFFRSRQGQKNVYYDRGGWGRKEQSIGFEKFGR